MLPPALFQFCFVAGVAILKAAANALAVARFEAHVLPLLYIGAALLTSVAAASDGALRHGSDPPRSAMVVAAAITVALAVGAWLDLLAAVAAVYLFAEAYATVVAVRFWASIGERFDTGESKRLFGAIGGFGMAGSAAAGLLLGGLGMLIGAPVALLLAAGTMLGCAALGRWMAREAAGQRRRTLSVAQMPAARSGPKPVIYPRGEALRFLLTDPYPRALAALSAMLAVLNVAVDFHFRLTAKAALGEAALVSLFGGISLALGVVAMFFQLFLSGRVLSRFGIFRYLLVAPLGCAATALTCIVWPTLAPAFVLKVLENLGGLSIAPTAMQLLYGPLPDGVGVPARALIDGLVKKSGAALGGVALLVVSSLAGGFELSLLILTISVAVILLLGPLKRLYVRAIDQRLTRAHWSDRITLDAEARALLLERLKDPDPESVLLAAQLLADEGSRQFRPLVAVLLAHSDERVRQKGVQLAAQLGLTELVPQIREMARSDARGLRDAALLALAVLDPQAETLLRPLLEVDDPGLRFTAIAALLRVELTRGESDGTAAREVKRLQSQTGASVEERREQARLCGRLQGTPFHGGLARLLEDPDPGVRALAIAAVGEAGRVELAPKVLPCLALRELRPAARQALVALGEAACDTLEDALNDRSLAREVRYEIPRLLRQLGTERAAEILLFSNIDDEALLRYRIALSLSEMRRRSPKLRFDPQRVREAIGRRVQAYFYYLPLYHDLARALPPGSILVRALEARLDQNFEIVFRLLGLLHPHRSMMNVFHRFSGGDARERAYAVELFENLVSDESLRVRMQAMFERYHRLGGEGAAPERLPARLLELVVSRDWMLRACARFTVQRVAPELVAALASSREEDEMSARAIEKVFLLEKVDIFVHCSVDDLTALGAIATERRYEAGELIFREKDPGEALYVVVSGQVNIELDGRTLLEIRSGSFGETSLLDGGARPADARAVVDSRVLVIDREDFLEVIADRPELLKGIFAAMTRHLRKILGASAAGGFAATRRDVA